MPVKLLPKLRLLNPQMATTHHLSFTMKLNPTLKTLRIFPTFSQIFPHNLKNYSLFSTRIKTRDNETRAASSKSLIDDEADLSDWVSGLKPNSFNTSLYSSDEDSNNNNKGRGKKGNINRGGRDSHSDDDRMPNRRMGRDSRSSLGGGRERFDRERRDGFREGDDRNMGFRDSKGYGNESRDKRSNLGGRERFDGERNGTGFREGGDRNMGFRDSKGYGNENRQMGRDKRSNLGGRERFDGERKGTGFREGGDRNMDFRDSKGYGNENRQMGRDSRPGSRGRERFEGERGGDRNMGFRDSKGYGSDNRQKGSGGLFRPSSGNPRGREKFGNGGELKRGEKGLSRGHFMSSDEEFGDEGEEVELKKSFSELVSEDSEEDDGLEDDSDDEEEEEEEEVGELFTGSEALSFSKKEDIPRVVPNSTGSSDSYLSETRFDQCSISPSSLKGIKDVGYEKMTVVQEATLPLILKGKDVLAKAKTGTGKTVAFLLPSIEVVAKLPPAGRDQKRPPIHVLVICPTRELANQAANEANTLLKYHPEIGVQVVIGGTRLALEQKRMQANPCQILVATPGRLKDHIENTAGFATRLMGVKVLVLDEADHLLDMGFRKDIERIIAAVPKQRQTLLFSATVPEEVRQICHIALRRDHEFVDTVREGTEQTHAQVRQMHLIAPLDKQFSVLYSMLKDHIANDVDYKVLVFCTTAMVTRLVANLLAELNLNVREIHSRKPQSYRTRVSDEFRKSKGLILVTSDVSARGVDYPDVSLVIQIGLPSDREQYIHRLGRTGRKGKEGEGILVLAPWEEFFLSSLKDLPISKAPLPLVDPETRKKVERALSHVEMKNKEAAYQAWLGFYNSNKTIARDKCKLVELANEFSRSMGLDNPPAIPKLVLGKMGLKNVPGLRSR